MKLLIFLFLVGFALASAVPVQDSELALADEVELEYLLFTLEDEGDEEITKQGKKLREHLEELLDQIKDAVDHGKKVKEETLIKVKQIRDKLVEIKEHISDKAKDLLQKIKEKGKDYFKKLWENLGLGKRDLELLAEEALETAEDDEIKTELGRRLREHLEQILAKIKEAIEKGKTIKEDYVERVNQLKEQLRKLKEDVGKTAKELIEDIKVIGKDYWQKILDKLGLGKRDMDLYLLAAEGDEQGKNLREHLEELLEQIRDAVEHGKKVKEETLVKVKQIRDKLAEIKEHISDKAKELLQKIKDKGKDYFKKLWENLGLGKRDLELLAFEAAEDDEIKTELGRKLRENLEQILAKIKEAIEKGRTIKEDYVERVNHLKEQLRKLKEDVGKTAKELIEDIKVIGKDYWQKILDKLGLGKRDMDLYLLAAEGDDEITKQGKNLREHLDELLEQIKDAVEHGKKVKEETLQKVKQIRDKLVEIKEHISDKAKDLLQKIKEKSKDYFKKLWENLGLGKRDLELLAEEALVAAEDDEIKTELGRKLREHLEEILAKIKEAIEKGKTIKEDYVEKVNQLREQLRKMKEDVGKTAKELIEKIKDIGKDYWKKILDKLGLGKNDIDLYFSESNDDDDDDDNTKVGKTLRDHLNELLEHVKDAVDHGKKVKEETLVKIKAIRDKLVEIKEHIGTKAKELIQRIKESGKDYFKKLWEKLGLGKRDLELLAFEAAEGDDNDIKTELGKKLREHLDAILEKIKDAVDHGKTVKDEYLNRLKEIREKLKDMKEEIGEKAKSLLEDIKKIGKDYFKKILEKLGLGKRDIEMHTEQLLLEAENRDEVINNLREKYKEILEKVKDMIENGKGSIQDILAKLRELRQKLKEEGADLGKKGKDLIAEIREKVREYFRNLLDKLGKKDKRGFNVREMLKKLRDKVLPLIDPEMIKAKIEEVFGKGNEYAEMLINKLKDKNEKAKQWLLDYIDKFYEGQEDRRRSLKEVYERVKNYLKDLKIELKEKFSKFGEWAVRQYEKGLEKGKDKVENLKKLAKEFIHDAKLLNREVVDQAKEFFKEYKEDLGIIYEDILAKIREIGKE